MLLSQFPAICTLFHGLARSGTAKCGTGNLKFTNR